MNIRQWKRHRRTDLNNPNTALENVLQELPIAGSIFHIQPGHSLENRHLAKDDVFHLRLPVLHFQSSYSGV